MTPPVAVLRPEPGNRATAARVAAMGWPVLRLPLFAVVPAAWAVPDPADFDAIVITSANAIRHAGAGLDALRSLPVFAVGPASAKRARAMGLTVSATGDDDAAALLASVPAHLRLLHLGGAETRMPDDARITRRIVYRSDPLPPPATLSDLIGGIALLHSPRAAARFTVLIDAAGIDRGTIALAALSAAVGDAAGTGWRTLAVAAAPREDLLCALIPALAD